MSFSLVHDLHLMKTPKGSGRKKKDKKSPGLETVAISATKTGGILKSLPVHRYSVVSFTFSGPLRLYGSTLLFESRVALSPGLGGVGDVASAISDEQFQ